MNQIDTAYRSELRELNELNFGRFDAKLEQRIAEVRGEIQSGLAGLKAELVRWMFAFWAGSTAILLGTMVALLEL